MILMINDWLKWEEMDISRTVSTINMNLTSHLVEGLTAKLFRDHSHDYTSDFLCSRSTRASALQTAIHSLEVERGLQISPVKPR